MTAEQTWLGYTLALTALLAFPYVLNRMAVRGIGGTLANPSPGDAPLAAWAGRAQRAHVNAIENLVVFAPAVLLWSEGNRTGSGTLLACQAYFAARAIHYVSYTVGIPGLRTLAYLAGWVCTAKVLAAALL